MRYYLFFIGLFLANLTSAQIFEDMNIDNLLKVRYGDVRLVEIDNDGDNDLIISGSGGENGYTRTYKNNGDGEFSLFQSSGLPPVNFSALATGDIDGDNDLDLFVTGHWAWSGFYAELFKNDGNGHFTSASTSFPGVASGESEFFDADNDGDLDLFYFGNISQAARISRLYLNDGAGNFTNSGQSLPPNSKGSLDIGDVNNDGHQDVLMCGESLNLNGTTQLLFNNGNGTFTDSGQSFVNISHGSAKFIDLEPDGDLDMVVNGLRNGVATFHCVFYANDGAGNYTSVGHLGLDSLRNNSLISDDIDEDGDADIFLSGRNSNNEDKCAVYLNNGTNFTQDNTFSHIGLYDGAAAFGRITDDCGIDLFYCGFGDSCLNESFVFRNVLITSTDCLEDPSEEEVDYAIFSNPTSDFIRVKVSVNVAHVLLYDDRGRLVKEHFQDDPNIVLDVTDLTDGVYVLKFTTTTTDVKFSEKCIIVD